MDKKLSCVIPAARRLEVSSVGWKKGFTLIELLVVIVIIGVLATLTVVGLNSVRTKARDTKRIADIRQLQSALEMYKNDNNVYPTFATSGTALVANGQTYMAKIPSAPNKPDGTCAADTYVYGSTDPSTTYTLRYCLGNAVQNIGPGNLLATPNNMGVAARASYIVTSTTPGTMADDSAIGYFAWSNPDNAKGSNNVYATRLYSYNDGTPYDAYVKIVKADGTIGTTNKSVGAAWSNTTDAYFSYGSSTNLWGETWTAENINDVDFGVVLSVTIWEPSHYLKATNFGFSIPSGSTINGILVEIERSFAGNDGPGPIEEEVKVDHIRITVYYTN